MGTTTVVAADEHFRRVQLHCNSNDGVLSLYKVETEQKQFCCKVWFERRSCSTQISLWPKPVLLKRGRVEVDAAVDYQAFFC